MKNNNTTKTKYLNNSNKNTLITENRFRPKAFFSSVVYVCVCFLYRYEVAESLGACQIRNWLSHQNVFDQEMAYFAGSVLKSAVAGNI